MKSELLLLFQNLIEMAHMRQDVTALPLTMFMDALVKS